MEQVTKKRLALFAGRNSHDLASSVAAGLGIEVGDANIAEFANGEIHCRFASSIRGSDVFIVNTHSAWEDGTINDSLIEHLVMVDAAKRASAKRITVVAPFYGYGRQDRKSAGCEPITAKLVANMFTVAGANRLVSVDLHSGQIQGFFDGPVDHLTAMPVLVDYLKGLGSDDLVVVSPDAGRVKVAERYANQLGASLAIVHKRRVAGQKNTVEAKDVVGDVDGKDCVLIDDMIDTGGTIVAAAEQLAEKGARSVWAATTHPVLSGPAVDRLKNSAIEKVIVTDTLPIPPEKQFDKLVVLSVAGIIARAIEAVFMDTTVSEIFDGNNLS
ncbi:MAG: ribose-phosphate diphosphokinase [Acidimicrobiia bacterium]|nr:ribose-phosphate diphosphokinase [Acidimicrobiia bacterium]